MKHTFQLSLLIWIAFTSFLFAQGNPSVGIGTFYPDPSAILELRSTSKGFLVPRMTTAQRNAISAPALWLLIFNTDTQQFEYWNGTVWIPLISTQNVSSSAWSLSGNTLTGSEFLGSVNLQPVVFKTNNLERMRISTTGNVGIGINAPTNTLHVKAASNPLRLEGLQPLSNAGTILAVDANGVVYTTSASAFAAANAWSLTGNAGTDPTTNFLGTTDNQPLVIRTNNTERMRILASGLVGIGTNVPTNTLHVKAASNPLRLEGVQTTASASTLLAIDANGVVVSTSASTFVANNAWALSGNALTGSEFLGSVNAQPVVIKTNNTEAMRIDANQQVGIGTNAPSNKLHVVAASNPLRLEGLQPLNNAGTILAVDANGVVYTTSATSFTAANAWSLTGNTGTNPATNFLGTTDNQPLIIKVNNAQALRIEPTVGSPNILGGYGSNSISSGVVGAVISGGGSGGLSNKVTDNYGVIGGGVGNQAGNNSGGANDAQYATVGGGYGNTASSTSSTVGGGELNTASGLRSTVGGGYSNTASGDRGTVGGGYGNTASGPGSTVAGGENNTASGGVSAVGGGDNNIASGDVSTVGGGYRNIASGAGSTVGGGTNNTASGNISTVSGGAFNTAAGDVSWAGGAYMYLAPTADRTFVWGYATATSAITASDAFLIGPYGNSYRVGINVANPTAALHVTAGSWSNPLRLEGLQSLSNASTILAVDASGVVYTTSATSFTAANAWALTGNAGTNPATNFLGTTDNQPLVIRTNNTERMRILASGLVGIGTNVPTNTLHVKATSDPLRLEGVQSSANATTLLAIDANGVVVSTSASTFVANNAWALSGNTLTGSEFLGSVNAQPVVIKTNNIEAMRIDASQQVGIGTNAPTNTLHVKAASNPLRLEGLQPLSNAGTILAVDANGVVYTTSASAFAAANAWALTGNAGTDPTTNFLGTTDNQPLVIRTNNTERMRILASGLVGIGTNAPTNTLHVKATSNPLRLEGVQTTASASTLLAIDANGVVVSTSASTFVANNAWTLSGNTLTGSEFLGSVNAQPVVIKTNNIEAMRIDAGQRVGIGTNAPSNKLHVVAASNPLRLEGLQPLSNAGTILAVDANGVVYTTSATSFTAANAWALTGNAGTDPNTDFLGTTDNQPLVIRTNNTERMRILASGLVGIGTNVPTNTLHVKAASNPLRLEGVQTTASASTLLAIDANGVVVSTSASIFVANNAWTLSGNTLTGSEFLGSVNAQPVVFKTSGVEAMRIDIDQQVGIGTSAPTNTLHVKATIDPLRLEGLQSLSNASTILTVDANGVVYTTSASAFAAANAWSLTGNAGTNPASNFLGTTDNQPLVIRTNNTERMRISTTGNVGIGTSAPAYRLHLANDGMIYAEGTYNAGATIPAGAKTAFIWNPRKAAIRAGQVTGNQWDDANVGIYSVAFGYNNTASGDYSTVAGGGDPLSGGNTASGYASTIGGGLNNTASGVGSTISGGESNIVNSDYGTVSGGYQNTAGGTYGSTVGGGEANIASNDYSTISGGSNNTASGGWSTISGGESNTASGNYATIGGGWYNKAIGSYSTVSGGFLNTASGDYSAVSGYFNTAGGDYSWVGGRAMYLSNAAGRTFVWGYATATSAITASDAFLIGPYGNNYRVGINVANPTAALHVTAGTWTYPLRLEGLQSLSNAGTILAVDANGVVYTTSATSFTAANAWALSGNAGTDPNTDFLGTTDNQPLVIRTNNTERMRILASGLVGIGTNVPTNTLHVKAASNPLRLEGVQTTASASTLLAIDANGVVVSTSASTFVANNAWALSGNTLTGGEFLGSVNAQPVVIKTNNTEAMRIDASQQVGIGTNAPSNKLHVVAASNPLRLEGLQPLNNAGTILAVDANGVVYTTSATSFTAANAWALSGNAGTDPNTDFLGTTDNQPLVIRTNNTERMRILASGLVGIGTNAPTNTLHVKATSNPLRLEGVQTTASASTLLAIDANGVVVSTSASTFVANNAWTLSGNTLTGSEFLGSVNAQPVVFKTNNTEAMRIDASQQVGIGTNAPTNTLHVKAASNPLRLEGLQPLSNAGTILAVDANGVVYTTSASSFTASNAWALTGNAGTNPATNFLGTTDNQPLVIRTNNTERMRILASGLVGIGTNVPTNTLHVKAASNPLRLEGVQSSANATTLLAIDANGVVVSTSASTFVANNAWTLSGNTLTGSEFLGSVNAQPVVIKTNNTEAMRIDANQQVGIGTNAPSNKLHVVAASNPLRLEGLQPLSNAGTILAVDANGVVYTTSASSFTASNAWALTGNAGTDPNTDFLGTTDNQPLVIRTNNTERMRILASGLVGIGTNVPTNTLHVKATSDPLRLEGVQSSANATTLLAIDANGVVVSTSASTFVANNAWALSGNTLTGSEFLGSVNAQPVVIKTNNIEAMRIDASQQVGIGTNAPTNTLHVKAASNPLRLEGLQPLSNAGTILAVDANGVVYTTSATSFTAANAWALSGNAGTDPNTDFLGTTDNQPLVIRTNNTERMRILASGLVGIGTNVPTNTLHVKAASNPLRLEGVQTTASASTLLAIDANGVVVSTSASTFVANNAWTLSGNTLTGSEFLGSVNAQPVVIKTNNTEAMRIDASQQVGIGTNAPTNTLHVKAASNPLRLEGLQPLSNAGTILAVDANGVVYTTSASSFTASNAWSLTGNAGTNPASNFLGTTDNQPLVIKTNNAERMRVLASGYVGVGTTSPTARLMAVEDAPGQAVMRIQNLDAAGLSGIEFLSHTSAVMGYVGLEPGGGALRIWSQSNMIRFYTNGVERVRITTTGNVGIGSLDPQYRLHIEGDGMMYASGEFGKGATMPEGAKTAFIWNPRKAALRAGSVTADQWNDAQVGAYTVAFGKNTVASGAFSVAVGENTVAEGTAAWVGGRNLHLLPDATGTFAWGNTERPTSVAASHAFLIGPGDTPYRVGINTATPTYALELPNDSRANVGQARANAWLTYADPRMWSTTEPISVTGELLSQLQPLRYRDVAGKSGFSFDPQQLAAILPEAVAVPTDSSQQWSINYAALIPVLVAMLQEQQQQIQQLRQQNLALQQQVAETQQLRKRLAKMEQQLSTLEQLQQQVRYLIQLQREARPVPTASNGGK